MRRPTTSHRARRAAGVLALVLVAGLAGYGGSALAGGGQTFSDVPPEHPFHDEIEWLADSGITTGYADGTFRPGQPVSRQAMAAYLERTFDAMTVVQQDTTEPAAVDVWGVQAPCPAGQRAIAGGGGTSATGVMLTDSRPNATRTGWVVRFESEANDPKTDVDVTAYATCIPERATS